MIRRASIRGALARLARVRARDVVGSITPFALIVSIALLALGGLVIDGGRQLNAKGRAVAYAQEAARAGAQAIDVTRTRTTIVPELARQIAQDYCDKAMAVDSQLVSCTPELVDMPGLGAPDDAGTPGADVTISVKAEIRTNPIMLNIFGGGPMRSSGEALARPVAGISGPDEDQVPSVGPPSVQAPGDGGFTTIPPGEPPPGQATVPCTESPSPPPTPEDEDSSPTPSSPTTSTTPPGPTVNPSAFCPTTRPPESPPGGGG